MLTLLALAACQAAPEPPPAVAALPAAAAPASPEGEWRGSSTVTQDRSGPCRSPLLPQTVLTISGDRFTIVNRPLGHRGSGMVTPMGALTGTLNVRDCTLRAEAGAERPAVRRLAARPGPVRSRG